MSEVVLWKVGLDDAIIGVCSSSSGQGGSGDDDGDGNAAAVLITAAKSGVALVDPSRRSRSSNAGGGDDDDGDDDDNNNDGDGGGPDTVWKLAEETMAACPAILVRGESKQVVVVAAIMSTQTSASPSPKSPKHRRSKSGKSIRSSSEMELDLHSELSSLPTSQLRAWTRDAEGLVDDMTLIDKVQGRVCSLIAWEEERGLIVAVTQSGSLVALALSCADGSISATRVSHVDNVGLNCIRAIDTCELDASRRALVLAGSRGGTKEEARRQVGVVVAQWSKSERQWAMRTRVIESLSSSSSSSSSTSSTAGNGEDLAGFAAWVAAQGESEKVALLWKNGTLEVFSCGELCLRKTLKWKVERSVPTSSPMLKAMPAKLKRKRRSLGGEDDDKLESQSRVGQLYHHSMVRIGADRVAIMGYPNRVGSSESRGSGSSSSSELSIGFLDVTFGKVSETLVVDDRDSTAATCALLGHQRSQGIFLGGSNVAVAMYPTSAGEWESTPILLSDVLAYDRMLTDSMFHGDHSSLHSTHRSSVDSLSVGLRSPPVTRAVAATSASPAAVNDGAGDLQPQDVWVETLSHDLSTRVSEIMQDLTSSREDGQKKKKKPRSQVDLARIMLQVLGLFFGEQVHANGGSSSSSSEASEDFIRKRLQDWKSTLRNEPSLSKRIPSCLVKCLIDEFVVGKHWMLLEFLIATNHIVSCERYPSLVPGLLEQKSISTLERLLVHVQEFPPHTLFQILCMILDSSEDQGMEDAIGDLARRKRERVAAASESFKKKTRTRNEDRVFKVVAEASCERFNNMEVCLHSFVGVPTDTSVTRAAVQELGLRQALALLDYFGKWFDIYRCNLDLVPHSHSRRPFLCVPSLARTVDWISCLLDAHFTKLIHADETAPLVSHLQKSLIEHLTVSERLSTLRGALHHIPRLAQLGGGALSEDNINDANPEMDLIIEQIHI